MRVSEIIAFTAVLVLATMGQNAQALVIGTETNAYAFKDQKTSSAGSLTSTTIRVGNVATAYADASGMLSVSAGTDRGWDCGGSYAVSEWENLITNMTSEAIRYNFIFDVSAIHLSAEGALSKASYNIDVRLGGQSIWKSSDSISGSGRYDYSPVTLGTLDIAPVMGSIDLGLYNPGESFLLEYIISSTSRPGMEYYTANSGPFSMTGEIVPTVPVPEPSTLLLFGAGLLGVGLVRNGSRKSRCR